MSSDTIARAVAFYRKALELEEKGHLSRAAENYKHAADAARALDPGPDNVAAVDMQCSQAEVLLNCALVAVRNSAAMDPLVAAAHRVESVALFSSVAAALERRRVAGTLREGRCSADEEAWFAAMLQGSTYPADEAAGWAPLAGYHVFLQAAVSVISLLGNAFLFAGECSALQFSGFARLVVNAADLIQQPRSHGTEMLSADYLFTERLREVVAFDWRARGLDARLVQLLTDAWQRLQRSGVQEARGILDVRQHFDIRAVCAAHDAAVAAASTAPGLRSCALAGCGAKEAHPKHFKRCSACQAVVYCSKEHQLEAWPAHKAACKAARKAAAATAAGGAGPGAAP